jgi:hypothetical protein
MVRNVDLYLPSYYGSGYNSKMSKNMTNYQELYIIGLQQTFFLLSKFECMKSTNNWTIL